MSKSRKSAKKRRAGKTIVLQEIPSPAGAPLFDWFVAPDADESFPHHLKSTDRDDMILVTGSQWYRTISIDGGGGRNVIQGTFGTQGSKGNFLPDVRNVQWALLRSETSGVALDFGRWTGLVYVEARGQDGPSSHDDIQTRFIGIPLGVKQLGVVNFNGIAFFEFAPPPPNSVASHSVDLFLVNNHKGGEIHIDSVSDLHIHATGTNGPQILHAPASMITVDRDGDVNLQHSSLNATTVDASAATGSLTLSVLSYRGVTITAGRGYLNAVTTNGFNDTIDFLEGHSGQNTYIPLSMQRLLISPLVPVSQHPRGESIFLKSATARDRRAAHPTQQRCCGTVNGSPGSVAPFGSQRSRVRSGTGSFGDVGFAR
jgi:hypothetical protein